MIARQFMDELFSCPEWQGKGFVEPGTRTAINSQGLWRFRSHQNTTGEYYDK